MKIMNGELKKVVNQVKHAQGKINALLKNQEWQDWMDEARKYADTQRKEVKKLITDDVKKLRSFLDTERKEMERFQRQIPGEIKKFRVFVKSQRREFEKLVTQLKKAARAQPTGAKKAKAHVTKPRKMAKKPSPAKRRPPVSKTVTNQAQMGV